MTKNKFKAIPCSILILASLSCASKSVENKLNQKISEETQINNQADLSNETFRNIEKVTGITEKQRVDLIELRDKTRKESLDLTTESLRMKSILIKDLLSINYNRNEVNLLKSKIKLNDEKKLNIFLEAITTSNIILGREFKKRETDFEEMYISHEFMY